MPLIFLDAGHGGNDAGAGSGIYLEKNLTLNLALKIRSFLLNHFHCDVAMSRSTDQTLSLSARTREANRIGADFLLSIHYNAFNRVARGYEDFTWNGTSGNNTTEKIRHAIHNEVIYRVLRPFGVPNRGKKKANFHMLRESNMPAVLVETLFCDSPADQQLIANPRVINLFAEAYALGIGIGMNLAQKKTSSPVTGSLYRVQVGAFRIRSNAEATASRLRAAGFPTFIVQSNNLFRVQCGAFSSLANAKALEQRIRAAGFPVFVYEERSE